MSLEMTLTILVGAVISFLFALFMDQRPIIPGKVRLFPYKALMFVSILAMVVAAAHLITLWTGVALPGRQGKF